MYIWTDILISCSLYMRVPRRPRRRRRPHHLDAGDNTQRPPHIDMPRHQRSTTPTDRRPPHTPSRRRTSSSDDTPDHIKVEPRETWGDERRLRAEMEPSEDDNDPLELISRAEKITELHRKRAWEDEQEQIPLSSRLVRNGRAKE